MLLSRDEPALKALAERTSAMETTTGLAGTIRALDIDAAR